MDDVASSRFGRKLCLHDSGLVYPLVFDFRGKEDYRRSKLVVCRRCSSATRWIHTYNRGPYRGFGSHLLTRYPKVPPAAEWQDILEGQKPWAYYWESTPCKCIDALVVKSGVVIEIGVHDKKQQRSYTLQHCSKCLRLQWFHELRRTNYRVAHPAAIRTDLIHIPAAELFRTVLRGYWFDHHHYC